MPSDRDRSHVRRAGPGTGRRTLVCAAAVLALLGTRPAVAQESMGTPAARAEFERGDAAFREKKYDVAVEAYKKAIALDPAYVAAHDQFVFVSRSYLGQNDQDAAVVRLEAVYEGWIKKEPRQAAHYWGLGWANYYKDPSKCEQYCRKAVEIDPRFAKAWNTLSLLSEMKGDAKGARENLRRAAEANPSDPSYLFYYSRQVMKADPAAGTKLALQVVEEFPTSERAAQSLYWLGIDEDDPVRKTAYLERLRKEFPPAKFSWSRSGMSALVDVYAERAPEKAVALAREMVGPPPAPGAKPSAEAVSWQTTLALHEALVKARALVAEKKGADALALLATVKPPRSGATRSLLTLLQAEAESVGGDAQKAYERLAPAVALDPAPAALAALGKYGAPLGKSAAQVDDDLWARRSAQAKPMTALSLPTYDGRTWSTEGYKGKVYLLNFWYPG